MIVVSILLSLLFGAQEAVSLSPLTHGIVKDMNGDGLIGVCDTSGPGNVSPTDTQYYELPYDRAIREHGTHMGDVMEGPGVERQNYLYECPGHDFPRDSYIGPQQ